MPVPTPLQEGHLCKDCKGTGADIARTLKRDRQRSWEQGYVMCNTCVGRGLDPAEYFNWGKDYEPSGS